MSTFDGSVWLETVRSDVDMESMAKTLSREVQTMLRLSNFSHVTSVYFGGGTYIRVHCCVVSSPIHCHLMLYLSNSQELQVWPALQL